MRATEVGKTAPPPPPSQDEPHGVLDGKYELANLIGHGGFGVVYQGRHLVLDRPVAIKLMRPTDPSTTKDAERFRLEGISACRVDHPNAVVVHDAGVTRQGMLYLVMELLEGRSLRSELAVEKRLSIAQCLRISERVSSVLATAHAKGVVHRDIKPDNIFLHIGPEGSEIVKVVDFGIAKLMHDVYSSLNTGRGMMIGTPEYVSPERLLSRPYDGRADVYALGCTMFEMLTGRSPFLVNREAPWLVAAAHIGDTPPQLIGLEPTLPTELAALVHATLEKDPSDRPTAAELNMHLAELLPLYE
jgi:eukaryotic-like serine/threonine-protein kinase